VLRGSGAVVPASLPLPLHRYRGLITGPWYPSTGTLQPRKPHLAPQQREMASWGHGRVEGGNVTPKVRMTTPFANEPPATRS